MYTVYILKDENGNLYKGMTSDIKRRLNEHRRGKTQTTRRMKNIKLVYQEELATFDAARKRELYLKTAAGRKFIKEKLRTLSSAG
ncbi:MAG: GIY-YIG nuclease family protein [Patescibacteria group bacterium]|nr:GIY-YIG nuclease family protein [Patescibacteria group bacterium]MDD4611105.1 GIY-YIG nuclease family protein [Patescibacteria group bacterium]